MARANGLLGFLNGRTNGWANGRADKREKVRKGEKEQDS